MGSLGSRAVCIMVLIVLVVVVFTVIVTTVKIRIFTNGRISGDSESAHTILIVPIASLPIIHRQLYGHCPVERRQVPSKGTLNP